MTSIPTHYEILSLPPSLRESPNISVQTLRNAYRRALLQNHPDKTSALKTNLTNTTKFTVDQISEAFNVLGDTKRRAKYDAELKLQHTGASGRARGNEEQGFRTGVEVVDLDDLECEEGEGVWYRSCRCGEEKGFEVREQDLEKVSGEGESEISVGCKGCSLWLRVLFGVVDEGDVENGG